MNVIELDQLDSAVTAALVRISNGVFDANQKGMEVEIGEQLSFQCTVTVPGGLNAIKRLQTQTPGKQTTIAKTDPAKETTTTSPQISVTDATESGQTVAESSQSSESATESQVKAYGKGDNTVITYDI